MKKKLEVSLKFIRELTSILSFPKELTLILAFERITNLK